MSDRTKPKLRFPKDYTPNAEDLAGGRYGTYEMIPLWGQNPTFEFSLLAQGQASLILSELHPEIISPEIARGIKEKATLKFVDAERIKEVEDATGHDVIGINTALEEVLSNEAKPYVNKFRTSADTTNTAKPMQIKKSLEVIADSVENLRDITIEKMLDWKNPIGIIQTHGYDGLPAVAGRPFAHYVEMMQSGLNFLKFVYDNSLVGKWGDVTGDHHGAKTAGIDGLKLQEKYCKSLGLRHMTAPAQVPGLEFEADVMYVMTRLGATMNNLARFIAHGKSDDVNIFRDTNPRKRKGSSGMPHKDAKGGNPTTEEQMRSVQKYLYGNMMTALTNCEMDYGRDLSGSADSRLNFEDGFKFLDQIVRRMASTVYWLELNEERAKERVTRTYDVITSPRVMQYLTDNRHTSNPMAWREAHDLVGKLATEAYENKIPFSQVLKSNEKVSSRLTNETIQAITNPLDYIGESERIIETIADKHHRQKTIN